MNSTSAVIPPDNANSESNISLKANTVRKLSLIFHNKDPAYNPVPEERPGGFEWGNAAAAEGAGQVG